jgi:single-strand DNA-binding protein
MVAGRFQQREFETKEGEKRNVIELVADEVGPSLRWATAQVEKVARDKMSSSPSSPPQQYTDEPF